MILFLNTSDFQIIRFCLIDEKKGLVTKEKVFQIGPRDSNRIVGELGKFISAKFKTPGVVSKIIIVSGPGSFTGIRIGVAASLALSLAWSVPVFAIEGKQIPSDLLELVRIKSMKKVTQNFEPLYGAEPNITLMKKKTLSN